MEKAHVWHDIHHIVATEEEREKREYMCSRIAPDAAVRGKPPAKNGRKLSLSRP